MYICLKIYKVINQLIPVAVGKALHVSSYFAPQWTGLKAVNLFCTPRKGAIEAKHKKFLDTADKRDTFNTEHGVIQYYIWNETGSKTLLLLHGWESNAARWRPLIKTLSDTDYRIVAIDAPAHGDSANKYFDMLQYMAAINKAVIDFEVNSLIGHSVGGISICYYFSQYKHPEFDQIVLLGTPTKLSQIVSTFYQILNISDRMQRLFVNQFENKFDRKLSDISVTKMIDDVKTPSLIIHDEKDEVISVSEANVYHELFSNSTLFLTDGYGHSLQNKKVYYKIKSFLKK